LLYLFLSSVVLADSPVRSLLEFSVSLPFRLCFLLAHCFQRTCNLDRVSVPLDCGCKSTTFFLSRNTFLKKILKYFLYIDCQSVRWGDFSKKAQFGLREHSSQGPHRRLFRKILRQKDGKTGKSH